MTALAPTLEAFFTQRLAGQLQASPHTIAAYRDTFRLLLRYAQARVGKKPSQLDLADLDAPAISAFLDYLEHDRGNTIRTRNARLAAIHSLFAYAALSHPEHAALISRVLAIPAKRFDKALVTHLTKDEARALLTAPSPATRHGRRDHALLQLAIQTGLRVSELTALTRADIHLGAGPYVRCAGKGRKERITPPHPRHRQRAARLAEPATQRPGQPGLSRPARRPAHPQRGRAHGHPARRHRSPRLPIPDSQEHHAPHAAALCGWPGYVAGSRISAGSRATRAHSGHITRRRIALSVHHDQKGRFAWRQQASARHQLG